jgi:hypothetical protein
VIAGGVAAFFATERNREVVEKLRAAGVDLGRVEVPTEPQVLAGMVGRRDRTLEGHSRTGQRTPSRRAGARRPGA